MDDVLSETMRVITGRDFYLLSLKLCYDKISAELLLGSMWKKTLIVDFNDIE